MNFPLNQELPRYVTFGLCMNTDKTLALEHPVWWWKQVCGLVYSKTTDLQPKKVFKCFWNLRGLYAELRASSLAEFRYDSETRSDERLMKRTGLTDILPPRRKKKHLKKNNQGQWREVLQVFSASCWPQSQCFPRHTVLGYLPLFWSLRHPDGFSQPRPQAQSCAVGFQLMGSALRKMWQGAVLLESSPRCGAGWSNRPLIQLLLAQQVWREGEGCRASPTTYLTVFQNPCDLLWGRLPVWHPSAAVLLLSTGGLKCHWGTGTTVTRAAWSQLGQLSWAHHSTKAAPFPATHGVSLEVSSGVWHNSVIILRWSNKNSGKRNF